MIVEVHNAFAENVVSTERIPFKAISMAILILELQSCISIAYYSPCTLGWRRVQLQHFDRFEHTRERFGTKCSEEIILCMNYLSYTILELSEIRDLCHPNSIIIFTCTSLIFLVFVLLSSDYMNSIQSQHREKCQIQTKEMICEVI